MDISMHVTISSSKSSRNIQSIQRMPWIHPVSKFEWTRLDSAPHLHFILCARLQSCEPHLERHLIPISKWSGVRNEFSRHENVRFDLNCSQHLRHIHCDIAFLLLNIALSDTVSYCCHCHHRISDLLVLSSTRNCDLEHGDCFQRQSFTHLGLFLIDLQHNFIKPSES